MQRADFIYEGEATREISFPLGGIGTGCIGLAGNGQLVDVEIFGKPNKGSNASLTHAAIKVQDETRVLDARALVADYQGCRTGSFGKPGMATFGTGPDHRATFAGFPHFGSLRFEGTFPVAALHFEDDAFPGKVSLTAFNPLIPSNSEASSLPAAFFAYDITNTTAQTLTYTLAFSLKNLYTNYCGNHSLHTQDGITAIHLQNMDYEPDDIRYGDLCICTDAADVQYQQYWYRGMWFDNLVTFWNDFTALGPLQNRVYPACTQGAHDGAHVFDTCTLAGRVTLAPGESAQLRFVMSWNTPNAKNTWNPVPGSGGFKGEWRTYYATRFAHALASGLHAMKHFNTLWQQTKRFMNALYASTLPHAVLEAITANLAVIKSPTCLRLENGALYGFEGCNIDSGSCEGTCTHVWSYTYAIAFLFPDLERSMRTLEYESSLQPRGGMAFRLMLPPGRAPWRHRPCVDGQYSTVMRVLREYRISGDKLWLEKIWPAVKQTVCYAWSIQNYDKWDPDKRGILSGRQHHTLDMELFGESAWLSGLYLGGLKAASLLAGEVGDTAAQAAFSGLFTRGKAYLNKHLFNGEYFFQRIDLRDKSLLDPATDAELHPGDEDVFTRYWNHEQGEIKYQIGSGCGIDQVLGQWHSDLIGLGEIFEDAKTHSALQSIYRYNFIPSMRAFVNPCRIFAMNDEGGLVICTWPRQKGAPMIPVPYAQETMNGFEYQAASHMIMRGMVKEGLTCVEALRSRYNGKTRNPWNEYECGSNYARSMASYALLLAYSGFRCDLSKGHLRFAPVENTQSFQCFWAVDGAWGMVRYAKDTVTVEILDGSMAVRSLSLGGLAKPPQAVIADSIAVTVSWHDETICFQDGGVQARTICVVR